MTPPLALSRKLQDRHLTDRCDVSRYTETNTPDGVSQGWTVVATGIPCRVSSRTLSASEGTGAGGQARAVSDWRIWLPAFTDVTTRDRLLVAIDGAAPRTFEVSRVEGESNETARACSAVEVT